MDHFVFIEHTGDCLRRSLWDFLSASNRRPIQTHSEVLLKTFHGSVFSVRRFKNLPALKSSLVTISNYDDRFRKPMFGGYRDINVLLRVVHHVCELQFNLKKMIDVKESAAGHGSYERFRLFNDTAILASINDDTVQLKTSLAAGADPSVREGRSRRAPALAGQLSLSTPE